MRTLDQFEIVGYIRYFNFAFLRPHPPLILACANRDPAGFRLRGWGLLLLPVLQNLTVIILVDKVLELDLALGPGDPPCTLVCEKIEDGVLAKLDFVAMGQFLLLLHFGSVDEDTIC